LNTDLFQLGALELSARFRAGDVTPSEALEASLKRISACNPLLNAIVTLDGDGAREAARASDARWRARKPLSSLDGVPVTIKENMLVRGLRATWGSRVFENYVPDHDELPVARLRAAGLVIVGKTNAPEFSLQGYTDNLVFGPTRNPWSPELTPGGSSGGAVASVASGMVSLAIGTDGGGSTRRPASHTGLVGLKPTTARIARGQGFPVILHDLEVVGAIARETADLSAMMEILSGPDPRDQASLAYKPWSQADSRRPLRILYIRTFGNAPVDPEIDARVREAATPLGELGHEIREEEVPFDFGAASQAFTVIAGSGLAWLMRQYPDRVSSLTPSIQSMLEDARKLTAAEYVETLIAARELKRTLFEAFKNFDVLMTPTAAALPWPVRETHPKTISGQPVGPRGHALFTPFANLAGCPGISLPCAASRSGLPIGFQLVAPWGQDELLVSLGRDYEMLRAWRRMVLDGAAKAAKPVASPA
jgi:aspartyl-tRNA(Asn)/glutamyl-tRNA(Gln) amidotransferase subunit A